MWFEPIEEVSYDVLYYYGLEEWYLAPMIHRVDTNRAALTEGERRGWPFRTHKAVAR